MRKLFVSSLLVLFPALATAQGPFPPAVPLPELVALLDSANPELAVARRETDAAIARIQPAGAPPDPAISAGYMSGFLRPPFVPSAPTRQRFVCLFTAGRSVVVTAKTTLRPSGAIAGSATALFAARAIPCAAGRRRTGAATPATRPPRR